MVYDGVQSISANTPFLAKRTGEEEPSTSLSIV